MKNSPIKNILLDIRFYLVLLFLLRLFGITDAPLESSHSWRQCFTNMISRNFTELGFDLMRPRIDLGGIRTGIVGAEFPLLNTLIHWFNVIFGIEHWYGRLINLLVTTLGLHYFYRLIKALFQSKTAFYSTLILALSVWFTFARKIMPDTFSVSLVIIGLFYAYQYLKDGKRKYLFLFSIFSTLGMLCKIPASSVFFVLVAILFIKRIPLKRKISLILLGGLSLLIALSWYFLWVPYLVETYQYRLFIPKGLWEGMLEIQPYWDKLLKRFYFDAFHSFVAFSCFIGGIYYLIKNKEHIVLKSLGLVGVIFFFYVIKTGDVFPLHSYYIIPIVPVMAFIAGYFLEKIPIKLQYLLIVVIVIESLANQHHDFKIKEKNRAYQDLEPIVNQYIPKNDLIVTSGGRDPHIMYFAHRKGWVEYNYQINRKEFTDSLATLGASFLIIKKTDLDYENKGYKMIYDDEYFSFYNLKDTGQ